MAFVELIYSKSQINKAGDVLIAPEESDAFQILEAQKILANWRGCHGYPINTFQATLRQRLRNVDPDAIVAQRLKRAPSIIAKMQRFSGMRLARMQDIGGLRAVVRTMRQARKLETAYRTSRFAHTLTSSKNYIDHPKRDGYRSIHLIFRYANDRAPKCYTGLSLELQLRTRLQHAWATAVETMGTFLGQALKSGQGEAEWRDYFVCASAALALVEDTSPVPAYEGRGKEEVFSQMADAERRLRVRQKLRGFAIAADKITTERGQGAYHLVVLDAGRRTVSIKPYPVSRLL